MPQDKLALAGSQAIDPRKLEPNVLSRVNPSRVDLMQVRFDVQHNPEIQELFRQFKKEGWEKSRLVDLLTTKLLSTWPEGEDPAEAVEYLVDEYDQLGEGIHLVSTETGRVSVILSEDDIYTPPMVAREDGSMAQPLDRIRPEVESAIVTWFHDQGREQNIVRALAERGHQTALLREMGDPRLLVATRRGRQHIVDSFGELNPKTLLEAAGGTSAAFLKHFTLRHEMPAVPEGHVHVTGSVQSKSRMGIQDPTTTNLLHNRPAVMAAALVQGWVREIARRLTLVAEGLSIWDLNLEKSDPIPKGLWILPPDLVRPFKNRDSSLMILPVEGANPVLLVSEVGFLKVPEAFQAKNFEAFDRWEAKAALSFDMTVDLRAVKLYRVTGQDLAVQGSLIVQPR
jgi:hypothetical protein